MKLEQRQWPRYAVRWEVSACELSALEFLAFPGGRLCGEIRNISAGGLCLMLDAASPLQSLLRCEISLPGIPPGIPTLVEVRWVQAVAQGYLAGVRFLFR